MNAANESSNTRTIKPRPRVVTSVSDEEGKRNIRWKRIALYVVLAIVFFLLGLIPMGLRARQYAEEREAAQHDFRLKEMETQLAAAVINADRGEYEPARQTASDFFTSLRSQIDRGPDSDLSDFQRERLKSLLSQRDDVITLLARSDPAAVIRLSDIYVAYEKAMNDVDS
jgi:flagellar biosynthesis/type III secretory pathway M-ring protein FliF/YscJ